VRTIDPKTGTIGTLAEFDKIDWDGKKSRSIFATAAHSFVAAPAEHAKKQRYSYVYAAIENNGIFQLNVNTKQMKEVKIPVDPKIKTHVWRKGYIDACIAAPVTADNTNGSPMLFLHYSKKVYALDASKCLTTKECNMIPITNHDHHEGFKKSMACAAHTYKKGKDNMYTMYVTQRGGSKIASLDLTNALKVKGATVLQTVIAQSTGTSTDGFTPSFLDFQSIAVYAPSHSSKPSAPYIILSGGSELRIFDHSAKHATTLAHTKDGAVVAVGDYAFSGREKISKTDLRLRVSCSVLNTFTLPAMVKWATPKKALYAKETKTIKLKTGASDADWIFTAYKKTAKLVTGVLEKTVLCSRLKEDKSFSEHCCSLKFSRKMPSKAWDDQSAATELY
jgi:hypothetical protein